jgi:ABC-2 type transport system permease protein
VSAATLAPPRTRSRVWRELNGIVTVMARDLTITTKSLSGLVMSLVMPLLMMGMIGGNLKENMAAGLGFDFGRFMLVGMLVNMLFMVTTMGMTTLVDDSDGNYSAELLVSPLSRYGIVLGKILGSAVMAIVSCLGVLVVGALMGISLTVGQLLALLALAPLMCLSGGALAMIILGVIKSNKTANVAVMLITMPQMFLSGVIIPIGQSTGVLWLLSRLLPMTYCVDLGRAAVYAGTPEYNSVVLFNPAVSLTAITVLTLGCLLAGTVLYVRSEKNR